MPVNKFAVEATFKGKDKVSAPVSKMEQRINRFSNKSVRDFARVQKGFSRMSSRFNLGGKAKFAATASVVGLTASLVDAAMVGAEFEQTMVSAGAKFGGIKRGTKDFEDMEKAVRKVGAATEFSSTEAGQGLKTLAKAGVPLRSAIQSLDTIVDIATANEISMEETARIVINTMGAFKKKSKDPVEFAKNLTHFGNIFTRVVNSADTDMEMFSETLKEGSKAGKIAGADFETMAAFTGIMGNEFIKSSKAGTSLKRLFLTLAAPKGEARSIFDRLGIRRAEKGEFRDAIDILGDLQKALDKMEKTKRPEIIESLFGLIALPGATTLLDTPMEEIRAYRDGIRGAKTDTKDMADEMRKTTQGAFKEMLSTAEDLKLELFGEKKGALNQSIKDLTAFFRENKGQIVENLGTAAGLLLKAFNIGLELTDKWLPLVTKIVSPDSTMKERVAGTVLGLGGAGFLGVSAAPEVPATDSSGRKGPPDIPGPAGRAAVTREETETTQKVIIEDRTGKARAEDDLGPNVLIQQWQGF